MDTEKSSKFLLPSPKEPQSKVTPQWLTQSSEFSMTSKKTLKTDSPLRELLKTKDLLLMTNSKPELTVKSTDLLPKLPILEDKFSNYNSLVNHTKPAETPLKDKLMMPLHLWVIEELDVKPKTTNSD